MDYRKRSNELDEWFEFKNPLFVLITVGLYLLLIYKCLPEYMKHRKAYNLKTFMAVYNVMQVIASIYSIHSVFSIASSRVFEFWECSILEPNSKAELHFHRLIRFTFWLKIVELSETVIFVLRKKARQISWLHVFHHAATLSLVFLLARYYRGGAALYPLLLNSTVHTFMYTYYFLAAVVDKSLARRLLPIKKAITVIQMVQFVLILIQIIPASTKCSDSPILVVYYSVVIVIFFYGFYDFYRKSYSAAPTPKKSTRR